MSGEDRGAVTGCDRRARSDLETLRTRSRPSDSRDHGDRPARKGATAEIAHRVSDKVRTRFHERDDGELPRYTFSCGIAELGTDGGEAIELLARADVRLYEAKRLGRDRTM